MISKISSNFNLKSSNYTNSDSTNRQMSYPKDSVSFKGNTEKFAQVGTDALLEMVQKLAVSLKDGQEKFVTEVMTLVQVGDLRKAIEEIGKNLPPIGFVKTTKAGAELSTLNWDGSPITHVFKEVQGFKNLGTVKDATKETADKLMMDAFGYKPVATIGPVGWTAVKPENVVGGTKLTKAELSQAYEDAFKEFFAPVDDYFVKGLGMSPKDRALVSSVSYSGIDKAVMDFSEQAKINTMTVTPYAYGIYGREAHPFPTVFTPDIPNYVDLYSKLSKIILVTGGRDHAFRYDAGGKWLAQNDGFVIPVDVLRDFKGIEVPSKINGKIENAAALAYETFQNPFPTSIMSEYQQLPRNPLKDKLKHPAQQALAAAIFKQFRLVH